MHIVHRAVKMQSLHSFVAVYYMNFILFLLVTPKLFSLSFVPLLAAPNPGDAIEFGYR